MFVIVNKYLLVKRFDGVVMWPFIFLKRKELKENDAFMNHERIHLKQQLELLVLLFYFWYFTEYLIRYFRYRNSYKAYSNISFEREAYANEDNLDYLRERKIWAFLRYL